MIQEKCKQLCQLLAKTQLKNFQVAQSPHFGTMSAVKRGKQKAILSW